MKNAETMNKITRAIGKAKLSIKSHSPEILAVAGVIGIVASTVLACKATIKAKDILEKGKEELDQLKALEVGECDETFEEDKKKALVVSKTKTGLQVAKEYAPAVALGAVSITCMLASTNILKKRNVALASAYATLDNSFKNYRNNVIERFGEDLDKEFKYNVKSEEVEEKIVDEKGKEKTVKNAVTKVGPNLNSPFARIYDDGCRGWQKDAQHNLWFLLQTQAWANQKLKSEGYLFLNDVYEELGFNKTKQGQVFGWLYNTEKSLGDDKVKSDGYVDFGIYDIHDKQKRMFVNGDERVIVLDFNVDGPILNYID